jgi:hypothetical protein
MNEAKLKEIEGRYLAGYDSAYEAIPDLIDEVRRLKAENLALGGHGEMNKDLTLKCAVCDKRAWIDRSGYVGHWHFEDAFEHQAVLAGV